MLSWQGSGGEKRPGGEEREGGGGGQRDMLKCYIVLITDFSGSNN